MKRTAIAICVVAGLGACTGSTDPTEAGFFDNIRNVNDGTYDRQVASLEQQAAQIEADNRATAAQNQALARQQAANAAEIAALQSEIADLEAIIGQTRAQVASSPQQLVRLDAISDQLQSVKLSADRGTDPSVLRSELANIRAAVRAISG